jgi:hypothetical protein
LDEQWGLWASAVESTSDEQRNERLSNFRNRFKKYFVNGKRKNTNVIIFEKAKAIDQMVFDFRPNSLFWKAE